MLDGQIVLGISPHGQLEEDEDADDGGPRTPDRREAFGLNGRDGADCDQVGDPEPDDGPVAREQRRATRRDDVQHSRGVRVAPRTAVQNDVAPRMSRDVTRHERGREVRARDGTDGDESRDPAAGTTRWLQRHDRERHDDGEKHPREQQVDVDRRPAGMSRAAFELAPHEALGELVRRERQRQRGDRDLAGFLDLRQRRHPDRADHRAAHEVRLGREAHGRVPNLTVRQATDMLPGRGYQLRA